eukprot:scaffold2152_cov252-Pinguiococcus_pyrenoidosus.AAC.7
MDADRLRCAACRERAIAERFPFTPTALLTLFYRSPFALSPESDGRPSEPLEDRTSLSRRSPPRFLQSLVLLVAVASTDLNRAPTPLGQ